MLYSGRMHQPAQADAPAKPAYRQVADQLRALVLQGALAPGERLPNESELSEMFGVGRSTVREALRVLSSQNMVVTSRGTSGGSFVAHPDPGKVSEFLEASLGLLSGAEALSVDELLEARELLEVPAARLAARRRGDAHLGALRAAVAEDREAAGRGHRSEANLRFHQRLLEAAGNRLLGMMTAPVFTVLQARFQREAAPQQFWSQIAADHARILERVEEGDPDGAAGLMLAHLEHLRPTYQQLDRMGKGYPRSQPLT